MISFRFMLDFGVAQLYRSSSTKRQFCALLNNFTANSLIIFMQSLLKLGSGALTGPEKDKVEDNCDESWQIAWKWPIS